MAVALAGLLLRLLIVAVHVPPAAAQVALQAPSLFSQIVLCTAAGLRIVKLDADGNPVEPQQSPGSAQSCPICTSLSGAPLALAPTLVALPLPAYAGYVPSFERAPRVAGYAPLLARVRDPPHRT